MHISQGTQANDGDLVGTLCQIIWALLVFIIRKRPLAVIYSRDSEDNGFHSVGKALWILLYFQ